MYPKLRWLTEAEGTGSRSRYFRGLVLPRLARGFDVELVPLAAGRPGCAIDLGTSLNIAQLEYGPAQRMTRMLVGAYPLCVIFHDLLLADHGPEPVLNSAWRQIVSLRGGAEEWPERGIEHPSVAWPGEREAALAAMALFTQERNLREYERLVPEGAGKTAYLPWPVDCARVPRCEPRKGEIAWCGAPNPASRAHKVLEAVGRLERDYSLTWLVDPDEEPRARDMLRQFGVRHCVIVPGRTPERWAEIVRFAECAVHMYFSSASSPGPYLEISLVSGAPCVVSRFAMFDEIPGEIACAVEPGWHEARALGECLERVTDLASSSLVERRREWASGIYNHEKVGEELLSALERGLPALEKARSQWRNLRGRASRALLCEIEAIFDRDQLWSEAWRRGLRPTLRELGIETELAP